MNIYANMVERSRYDTITINLMLTTQCTFACQHCFFGCSPKGSEGRPDLGIAYITNEVLDAVYKQIERLKELDLQVEVNLIGGEPTLKLDRFAEIIRIVENWEVPVTMTTNGWWLNRPETIKKFLYAVRPLARFGEMETLSVRISNDQFHKAFRKHPLPRDILNLWECPDEYDFAIYDGGTIWRCAECQQEYEELPEVCECGCDNIYRDIDPYAELIVPQPDPNGPWIYIEKGDHYAPWISGYCKASGRENSCNTNYYRKLTYEPDGALMDICCMGSYLRAGTVHDDPIDLLIFADMFLKTKKPSCGTCMQDAQWWVNDNLEAARSQVAYARKEYDTQSEQIASLVL